jgi:GNAT superfamily N-acetyltransferase
MSKRTGGPEISIMTQADIAFAQRMTDGERWGYLRRDFEDLVAFEPGGCFVARVDGKRAGIVTSTSYGTYAFVGTLIVETTYRNAGIGSSLLEHAMSYLRNKGVRTIELDGVFEATSLYRRLGFKDKYLSLRFLRPHTGQAAAGKPPTHKPSAEIVEFDREMTGIERERIIRHYLEQFSRSALVLREASIRAYAFARPRAGGTMGVGPFVADDDSAAEHLMREVIRSYPEAAVSVGVPDGKRSMVDLLPKLGFRYKAPSLRMYWGDRKHYETHVYGILSPEKG